LSGASRRRRAASATRWAESARSRFIHELHHWFTRLCLLLARPVHEHSGNAVEEFTQKGVNVRRQLDLVERIRHQLQPALAGGGVHRKGHMTHPQTWVAALLDVSLRSAEPADEEVAQPLLGAGEILRRVH